MRLKFAGFASVLVAVVALAGAARSSADESTVEEWPLPEVPEPSGVSYHAGRKTLFVASDQGKVAEIGLDGRLLRVRNVKGDLEGVVCHPQSGLVYVVHEGADVILEIRPEDLTVVREITVSRAFGGDANYLHAGGDGLEGIALKPGADGVLQFFAVNQYDPPVLLQLELPPKAGFRAVARIVNAWPLGSPPLSDVSWDPVADAFIVVSALWRSASLVSDAGAEIRSVRIPGIMQEGIARLPDGAFVIVQDTGGLLKWTPSPDPFAPQDRAGAGSSRAPHTQSRSN